jgi:hypothetical protein
MTLSTIASLWLITIISPVPQDREIVVVVTCADRTDKTTFFAYNAREVTPDKQEYSFNIPPRLPKNDQCELYVELRRNDTDDPKNAYVGAILTEIIQ